MCLIFPLIIALLIGDTLFLDYTTGFLQYSLSRIDYIRYIKNKIAAVSVVTFVITFIFQIGALFYTFCTSPFHMPTSVAIEDHFAPGLSTELFVSNPYVYLFNIVIIFCLISASIAVLGLIESSIFKSIFTVISAPWLVIVILGSLLYGISPFTISLLGTLSPLVMVGPFIFNAYSFAEVWSYWGVFSVVSAFIAYRQFLRKFKYSTL